MDNLIFKYVEQLKRAEKSLENLSADNMDTPIELVDSLIEEITSLRKKLKFLEDAKDNKQLLKD